MHSYNTQHEQDLSHAIPLFGLFGGSLLIVIGHANLKCVGKHINTIRTNVMLGLISCTLRIGDLGVPLTLMKTTSE
jgi:hypothetical protein